MSRRKPVPKFIPSPPPSPPSSPGVHFTQISIASCYPTQTDMPPLPEDWRDVIDRVISKERLLNPPTINTVVDQEVLSNDVEGEVEAERQSPASTEFGTTKSSTFAPPSPCESFDGEPVSRPDSPTPWSRPGSKRKQTEYRPPTPPLPRRRSQSAESGSESPTVIVSYAARTLPPLPHNERKPSVPPPLPAPKPVRPLRRVDKVHLPSPPPSLSMHGHPTAVCSPSHAFSSSEQTSPTLCSSGSPDTHTPSPSTPYSEKHVSRPVAMTGTKSEQHTRNPSVEQVRTRIEKPRATKSLPAKPGSFHRALTRGMKRVRALVASAFLCRS